MRNVTNEEKVILKISELVDMEPLHSTPGIAVG